MSIWSRISAALSALSSGAPLSDVFDRLRTPPEKSVAFAIAVIALGAKLAKADGTVTRDEVRAFREVFIIPKEEEANAARVFNLARQDVAVRQDYVIIWPCRARLAEGRAARRRGLWSFRMMWRRFAETWSRAAPSCRASTR